MEKQKLKKPVDNLLCCVSPYIKKLQLQYSDFICCVIRYSFFLLNHLFGMRIGMQKNKKKNNEIYLSFDDLKKQIIKLCVLVYVKKLKLSLLNY